MIKASGDYVILEIIPKDPVTSSGILLDTTTKILYYKVVSIGPNVDKDIHEDDYVVIEGYVGDIIDYQGVSYKVVRQAHVIAILEESETNE